RRLARPGDSQGNSLPGQQPPGAQREVQRQPLLPPDAPGNPLSAPRWERSRRRLASPGARIRREDPAPRQGDRWQWKGAPMIAIWGVYPPIPTFFDENEDLDLATLREHLTRLNAAGITGFVALGSKGEAVHRDRDERRAVIATTREMAGPDGQVLAGAGTDSTRETISLCQLAAEAGADVALVLPPHHYRSRMDAAALRAHYLAVADAGPLPVMIYNMPANTAGVDLDAETVVSLSAHPNIA